MGEKITVMSAEQYFQKFAVKGIGEGADRWMVKRQLIDTLRREVFGLLTDRLKCSVGNINDIPEGDPEASRTAKIIIHDTTMKWKKLIRMFEQYEQTANLLKPEDLKLYDEIGDIGTTSEDAMKEAEERANGSGPDEDDGRNDQRGGAGRDLQPAAQAGANTDRHTDGSGNRPEEKGASGDGGHPGRPEGYSSGNEKEEPDEIVLDENLEVLQSGYVEEIDDT